MNSVLRREIVLVTASGYDHFFEPWAPARSGEMMIITDEGAGATFTATRHQCRAGGD